MGEEKQLISAVDLSIWLTPTKYREKYAANRTVGSNRFSQLK